MRFEPDCALRKAEALNGMLIAREAFSIVLKEKGKP